MNDEELAPSGGETEDAAVEVENPENSDDNSIRELLQAQLASGDADEEEPAAETPAESEDGDAKPEDDLAPYTPVGWTDEERALWTELPEPVRDAVERQEKAANAKIKSDAELQKVIEPLAEQLEGTGVHPDQYIDRLIQADRYIDQQPLQAVLNIVQRHGLQDQLAQALGGQTGQPEPQAQAPQQSDNSEYLAQVVAAQGEWFQFVTENPDANSYKKLIAAELTANPNQSYQQAYEAAKETVTGLTKGQTAAKEADAINKATEASEKAKRLKLPKGKSGNNAPIESTGNIRDDVRASMLQAGVKFTQ